MPILTNEPKELLDKVLPYGYRGVFLGGCIERKEGSNIRPSAHCHCHISKKEFEGSIKTKDGRYRSKWFGWVCLKSSNPEKLVRDGKVTNLFKHELAHLMSAKKGGYGKEFCRALVELNGKVMKYDHKTVKDNIKKVRKEK